MSVQKAQTLKELLQLHGHSYTKQRQAVFKALLGQEAMNMNELNILLAGQLDRVSVYRTIALFEQLGIVQRLNNGWKYKLELTDVFNEHHHHLSCIKCGKIISLNEDSLEEFITNLSSAQGFKPTKHQVEIQGYCRECQYFILILRHMNNNFPTIKLNSTK
jgi:Fur family ferric uptake transcriptional regulator